MSAFASIASQSLPVPLEPGKQAMGETSFNLRGLKDKASLAARRLQPAPNPYEDCFGDERFEYTAAKGKLKGWKIKGTFKEAADLMQHRMKEEVDKYLRHPKVDIVPWIICCVLLGRNRRCATPYVVLVCAESKCRKALRAQIDQSHFLVRPWRCFSLPWNVIPLMKLLAPHRNVPESYEPYEIYVEKDSINGNINGMPIEIWHFGNQVGRATIGGIVRAKNIDGHPGPVDLAMTVAHVFSSKGLASSATLSPPDFDDTDTGVGVETDDENIWPEGDDESSTDSDSAAADEIPFLSRGTMETTMRPTQPFREKVRIGRLVFMSGQTKEVVEQSETPSGGLDWGLIALDVESPSLANKEVMALGRADSHLTATDVTVLTSPNPTKGSTVSSAVFGLQGGSYASQPVVAINLSSVKPGDSGCWVVQSGVPVVLGMLIGACPHLNEAYYIPLEQILEDVKRQTGMTMEITPPKALRNSSKSPTVHPESNHRSAMARVFSTAWAWIFDNSDAFELSQASLEHVTDKLNHLETTRLILASKEGSLQTVKLLLEEGVEIGMADKHGTALQHATSRGHLEVVRLLLEKGSDPNARDIHGNTALHSASKEGHIEIARLLLEAQADSDISNNSGGSPLSLAANKRDLDMVLLLVTPEASRKFKTYTGGSLLHVAVAEGHLGLAKRLIDNGSSTDCLDYSYRTPLHMASQDGNAEMISLLVGSGANVNLKDYKGLSPLHLARTVDIARLLTEAGADVHSRDLGGNLPVLTAAEEGHTDMVQFLLDIGAKTTDTNELGQSPIHLTSTGGQLNVANMPLSRGAYSRDANSKGDTPLHKACFHGHLEVVEVLLDGGVDAAATNERRLTPLHRASARGRHDVVQILLDHGADASAADVLGVCPIHLASYFGNLEVVRLLLEHGADPSVAIPPPDVEDVDYNPRYRTAIGIGQTPLHIAFDHGHPEVASLLVQYDADLYATDSMGRRPRDMRWYRNLFT